MTDCLECLEKGSLKKLLTTFSTTTRKSNTPKKVGEVTEEFIESARDALVQQKQNLEKNE